MNSGMLLLFLAFLMYGCAPANKMGSFSAEVIENNGFNEKRLKDGKWHDPYEKQSPTLNLKWSSGQGNRMKNFLYTHSHTEKL